jgi:hypothetical protein
MGSMLVWLQPIAANNGSHLFLATSLVGWVGLLLLQTAVVTTAAQCSYESCCEMSTRTKTLNCVLFMCPAGIANCFIGVILMHDLKNAALVAWLTPICVLLGLLALAGVVLEVPKRTVSI